LVHTPGLLLCGGTGDLGGRIARRLAEDGVPFRALVRPKSHVAQVKEFGAELALGDLLDPQSLDRALAGVRTVVTTANAVSRMMAGDRTLSIDAVDRQGQANLIRAAEHAGVERFVYVSAYGLTARMTRYSPFAAAKKRTEELLEASHLRTVLVRPAAFLEVWMSGTTGIDPAKRRAVVFGTGRSPVTFVGEDDVAAACVRVATMPDPPAVLDVGGPSALTRREAIELYEHVFGAPFRRVVVPRAALHLGVRALRRLKPEVASVLGIALTMDIEGCAPSPAPLRALGIEPRSPADFLAELAR
jgi:uncharacterized protein YbjT (DUF2867 family)